MLDLVLKAAVVVVCFVVAVPVGTPAVRSLLKRVERRQQAQEPGAAGLLLAEKELAGGYWIGLLERAALYACVLSGFPAGIAVVLGVKSIGRYPELRTPTGRKGELFIIGTFASMLWAAAFAGVAYGAVRLW